MKAVTFQPFYTPNLFALNVSLGALVCDDEGCGAVHGYSLVVQFMWWGFDLSFQFSA